MRRAAMLLLLSVELTGCASTHVSPTRIPYSQRQEEKLASAVEALEVGETRRAAGLFLAISAEPSVPGVTDEALFRLALLRLMAGAQQEGPDSARELLKRLVADYPTSSWSKHAVAILGLLDAERELLETNRGLKSHNLTLGLENKDLARQKGELQQKLDRLKDLDLELEDKGR